MKVYTLSIIALSALSTTSCDRGPDRQDDVIAENWAELNGSTLLFRGTSGQAASSVTCRPPEHSWCQGGFSAACDNNGGGLSTEPDGITCSFPEQAVTRNFIAEPLEIPPSTWTFRQAAPGESHSMVDITCNDADCGWAIEACDKAGGGLSTEPDGGVTCSVEGSMCSGCDD